MSLVSMTMRRVKRIVSWVLAVIILALLGAGAYYVVVVGV